MDLLEACAKLEEGLARNEFICFYVNCSIKYSGRAESYLDFGDRLIVIKQDQTVLIHQPEKGNPINYIKGPAAIDARYVERTDDIDHILFLAKSRTDEIKVEIIEVYEYMTRRLEDGAKQDLSGTEKEMSDMLKDNPQLISKDFVPLSREEHTKYGFIDVFGHDGDGTLVIVECKRYTAGLAAATQLRRYVEKMKSIKGIDKVKGILAAPSITTNAQQMLADWNCSFVMVEPPKREVKKRKQQKRIHQFFE